ncbi:MAG: ABATE domain-containing protein [Acidobacteriota bacterium]
MPEKSDRGDLLFLAGHPCLDFLNTRPFVKGHPVELLGSFEDFVRWLTRAGRLDSRAAADALRRWGQSPEGPRIVERARAFRETLRHMAEGLVRERGVAAEGPAAINFILAENEGTLRLERQGPGFRTRFASKPAHPISLLGNVAETAADLMSSRDLRLVRQCGNPDCVLFFYDGTRNHRRQWCAMRTCGNRMKVRAFRKRTRGPR